jgi:hypothetical protein
VGEPGSVFRRLGTVVRHSEQAGIGGMRSVGCGVAEMGVVGAVRLRCCGGLERVVDTSKHVVEGSGGVVPRSEAGGTRGDGGAVCDVAGDRGEPGLVLRRFSVVDCARLYGYRLALVTAWLAVSEGLGGRLQL